MNMIPFISSNSSLAEQTADLLSTDTKTERSLIPLKETELAKEFLKAEMPDLILIDFSDKELDSYAILDMIIKDTWLLHGGIIALYESYGEVKKIEDIQNANIIVTLTYNEVDSHLMKMMAIIDKNATILFQKEIGKDLVGNISGAYRIENDPIEVKCYTNLICNFLHSSNKIDSQRKGRLKIALTEMLLNAIEHGNCNISYDEKSNWLNDGRMMDELIFKKCRDPKIASKKTLFEFSIDSKGANFFIADQGNGFDWRNTKDATNEENTLKLHGRGIFMTKTVVENLTYNEKGNEVRFEMSHQTDIEMDTPEPFHHLTTKTFNKGEIVFQQGEPGTFLYYIVKGEYDVFYNDTLVSTITVDDVFMGEMSFLLNNKRSATVKTKSDGKLIGISKRDFVEAIKKKPHYALFISRLLAKRVQRLNTISVDGNR